MVNGVPYWSSIVLSEVYEAGTFSFYARAVDANGVTGHISAVANVTVVRVVVPGVVASFTVTVSGTTIVVSWTPPTNDGGGAITGYRIIGSLPTLTPTASERSRTFRDLADGTYFFAIEAQNSEGYGASSARRSVSVSTTVPFAPRLSGFLSGTSGRLSWNTPNNGGRVIGITNNINFRECGTNTNSYNRSLATGTTSFRVRAYNSNGFSAASNSVSITRVSAPSAPRNVRRNSNGSFSFDAPSNNGGDPSITYTWSYDFGAWTTSGPPSSANTPGSHTFRVRAHNSGGTSPIASLSYTIAQPVTRPGIPTSLDLRFQWVNFQRAYTVFASWNEPSNLGGASSVTYDVYWLVNSRTVSGSSFTTSSTSVRLTLAQQGFVTPGDRSSTVGLCVEIVSAWNKSQNYRNRSKSKDVKKIMHQYVASTGMVFRIIVFNVTQREYHDG